MNEAADLKNRWLPAIIVAASLLVGVIAVLAFTGDDNPTSADDQALDDQHGPVDSTTGSGAGVLDAEGGGEADDDEDDIDLAEIAAGSTTNVAPFSCDDEPERCPDEFDLEGYDGLMNVGGDAFTDEDGHDWAADACTGGNVYVSPNDIQDTKDDTLFQARRFEPRCAIEVEDGIYEVAIGWSETYDATPGYRVFPLMVEGEQRATVDVGRAVGIDRPFIQLYEVNVVDGRLDIAAPPQENRSMLAAIGYKRIGDPLPVEVAGGQRTPVPTTRPSDASPIPDVGDGDLLTVGSDGEYSTLQEALDDAQPGQVVKLLGEGPHPGPVSTVRAGTASAPITVTADPGAYLECPPPSSGEIARCFQLHHSSYRIVDFAIVGGSSNLYMVGDAPGSFVTDVKVINSVFRGAPDGGTGECIRIKYQATNIEVAGNDIADCGLGKCCNDSKNGEGIYIGTAPEQLEDKNPSPERDETNDIWVHHNTIRSLNECVEGKEGTRDIVVEYNSCKGQLDEESGGFGSRGGQVGAGNVFRWNLVEDTAGACVRFGGDDDPDGTGNDFYGNICRDVGGEYGVKQQREPQGRVCGNTFDGAAPSTRVSRDKTVDATAPCPAGTPDPAGPIGAGRPNQA